MKLLAILALALVPQESKPLVIDAGALTCEVHVSRTAHLFHVVDQLAQWSEHCHLQYVAHFEGPDKAGLTAKDLEQLARHAEVRKVRPWHKGLEQTFYSPLGLKEAIQAGVVAEHLTEDQGRIELEVLEHFAPRIEKLLEMERKRLEDFGGRLAKEKKELAEFANRLSKLFKGAKVAVPIYLIANPHDANIGGGYNGGRLTLEVPRVRDAYPSLLHEVFHAFLELRGDAIAAAAKGVTGLDSQTLNEGLAHGLAPGLFHTGKKGEDPLADKVNRDKAAGKNLKGYDYRVHRFGLELRPMLKEALDKGTASIDEIIPRAAEAWKKVVDDESKPAR